ncbi:MAG TPA: DUF4832 domain-containing protein [Paludibacter sp.]|jgi:hypothetical protein|nr:DUF4832 domain-containing protein [Paludibacter sp.]
MSKRILIYFLLLSSVIFSVKSQIVIDGDMSDWDNVPILSEPGVFPMVKVSLRSNPDLANVNYTPSQEIFPNPERGFYKYTEINLGSGTGALTQSQLEGYRQNNISLIYRINYLRNFRNAPLNQTALNEIEQDFVTARDAGVKIILRFAYSGSESEPDAPLNIIKQHLGQLKPILEENVDVIYTVQAGFIGAWGEWYYTSNNLNTAEARAEVISKLLETVPKNRTVQLRTPAYKQQYFQRNTPLTYQEAFKETDISRVGHHNDCFLASLTDYGTYTNPTEDKAYLNEECLFVPIGGETCPPTDVDPANSDKAQTEMRYLRWSYLNEDYYRPVNDTWESDGGMNNILRELGYRFQLTSGKFFKSTKPGGKFYAKILIKNLGYAPIYNKRWVEIILKNNGTNEKYRLRLNETEPRLWQPLVTNEIIAEGGVPADIPEGSYTVYLNLPDVDPTIYANPHYSIRLANEGIWEASTGYNKVYENLTISVSTNTDDYSGSSFFEKMD